MNGTPAPQPTQVYTTFVGNIDQAAVQRFFIGMATVMATPITDVHVLFQSTGGFIGDGVCLYNYFQSLPFTLTLYNAGSVQSIATIAYLGAKKRKVSTYATFMIHRSYNFPQAATATRLESITHSVRLDDQRTEAILRKHIRLTDAQWNDLDHHDLVFSAEEAIKIGLADEITDFAPPKGTRIYNI